MRTRAVRARRLWSRWPTRLVGALLLTVLAGCEDRDAVKALDAITAIAIESHLVFLAGDLLEGRAPGTPGSRLAASYIAAQFAQAGLEPVVGDSSYLQPIPLVARLHEPQLSFRARGGGSLVPVHGSEFTAWSRDTSPMTSVSAELAFVGFGTTAPEYGWDDYKDANVRGKVVLALAGDPGRYLGDRFRGDTATHYGFPSYKYEEAARHGALGAILVHSDELGYGWDAIRSVRTGEQLRLDAALQPNVLAAEAWMTSALARQVSAMAGLDFETLLETARDENFRPIDTGVTVSAMVGSATRRFVDANVAGLLRGGDPELAGEVVVFTAHYDHVGIGESLGGDSIYNGAYDNASGTALLLCLADAFGRLRRRPARSILFLAVTANEAGFLGSQYYVENPLIPLGLTLANLNIDGGNLWGPTEDVVVFGTELAGLGEYAADAASAEGLRLEGDWAPEWGLVYRSDQYSFISAGIPAVLVGHGLEYIGRMPGWGRQTLEHYFQTRYHRPGDEYQPGLDLRGAVQQARVAFRLGLRLANSRRRPVGPQEPG